MHERQTVLSRVADNIRDTADIGVERGRVLMMFRTSPFLHLSALLLSDLASFSGKLSPCGGNDGDQQFPHQRK